MDGRNVLPEGGNPGSWWRADHPGDSHGVPIGAWVYPGRQGDRANLRSPLVREPGPSLPQEQDECLERRCGQEATTVRRVGGTTAASPYPPRAGPAIFLHKVPASLRG